MIKCFEILDKCNASIFRVNELVRADAEVMQRKKMSSLYRVVFGCLVMHSHTRQEGTTGLFQAKENQNSDVWLTVHRNSVWIRKTN